MTHAIPVGSTVGIDTVTFIYMIEAVSPYVDLVRPFFHALARGELRAVTSVIAVMELTVGPLRSDRTDVADDYELILGNYPNLEIIDVNRTIARRAAELRAAYRLRPADSLHLATAQVSEASYFITNDRELMRVSGIKIVLIDSLLAK